MGTLLVALVTAPAAAQDGGLEQDGGISLWDCEPAYYGASDGCDCGCGEIDPDCGEGGCADHDCYEELCDFCYIEGEDVGCQPPPPEDGGTTYVPPARDSGIVLPPPDPADGQCACTTSSHKAPLGLSSLLVLLLAFGLAASPAASSPPVRTGRPRGLF